MTTMVMQSGGMLPWDSAGADRTFRRLLVACLGITFLATVVIPAIDLPDVSREASEQLPPQFAELILPPAPEPKPKPRPVEKEPEPKPPPEVKPEPVEQVVEAPKQTVQQAREKAKVTGLLAFADDLADLREQVDVSKLKSTDQVRRGAGDAATLDRFLLTADNGRTLANVNTSDLSRATGGVALAARETTIVEAPEEETLAPVGARRAEPASLDTVRSIEQVRRVFDANKGAIFAIYNRALRKNPGIAGKVVLELEISPDGQVTDCKVVSTDIADDGMLTKLVRRVQLFDFGVGEVAVTRINYPVHFLPS